MASFWEAQTQPSLYGYRPNSSIRDLILMGGQERAQAADRSAAIWMHTLNNVGQQVSEGVQQYSAEKKIAKRDAETVAIAQNWDGKDPNVLYKQLLKFGPDYAEKHAPAIMAFHSKPTEDPKTELQNMYVAGQALTADDVTPEKAEAGWQAYASRFGKQLVGRGIISPEILQGPYTEEHKKALKGITQSFGNLLGIKPEKSEAKVVGQNEKLIGPDGKVLYAGELKPQVPKAWTHVDLADRVNFYDENNNLVKTEMKGAPPRDPNIAANQAATRGDARLDKSYQFNSTQLESLRKPIIDQAARFDRLTEAIDAKTPQADALIAPELLSVMAGGSGSGLRMNEAEISRLVGGRSNFESLKAMANKWSLDPSKALSITDPQRADIKKLVAGVRAKIDEKAKAFDEAGQELIEGKSVEDHRSSMAKLRSKLTTPAAAAKTPISHGVLNGRKVVKYSDGSMEYEE